MYYSNRNDKKADVWKRFEGINSLPMQMYVMVKSINMDIRFAPLYIHSFHLVAPKKFLEAQLFHQKYRNFSEINNMQERLRWLRHKKGLMQKDMAEVLDCYLSHYRDIESGKIEHIDKELVDKISKFHDIKPEEWMDEYNMFLYKGQGTLLKEYRESLGLGKRPLCELIGVHVVNYRFWEADTKVMTKSSFDKYFKGRINM